MNIRLLSTLWGLGALLYKSIKGKRNIRGGEQGGEKARKEIGALCPEPQGGVL